MALNGIWGQSVAHQGVRSVQLIRNGPPISDSKPHVGM